MVNPFEGRGWDSERSGWGRKQESRREKLTCGERKEQRPHRDPQTALDCPTLGQDTQHNARQKTRKQTT
eukprot:1348724-Rhodomonas_salina.4